MTAAYPSLGLIASQRAPRRFAAITASSLAVMLSLASMPNSGLADTSSSPGSIMLSSSSWSVNLGSVLSYDPSTGAFTMPSTGAAPTGWNWSVPGKPNTGGGVGVYDPATGTTQDLKGLTQTESDGTVIAFYATGSTDPFLSYGFAVSNPTSSVQTYTFTDGATVTPTFSGNYSLLADIGGSITNTPVTGDSAEVAPVASAIQALQLSTDGGASFTDAGVDVGPDFITGIDPGTYSYGVFSSSLSGTSGLSVDYWQIVDQFSLTGNGDSVAFTGFAEVTANNSIIPEPSAYAALLGALSLGLVLLRRKKKELIQS